MARMPAEIAATGNCTDPSLYPWLDEAHRRPGGKAAKKFAELACSRCPIRDACRTEAIEEDEYGFWAGTRPYARTLLLRNGRHRKEGTT
jgi:hypothetical protein